MCGIIGSVNIKFDVNSCTSSLLHRGPDEQNTFMDEKVLLHHLRLTILDSEGGKQPMHYLDRYVITFNGEMYNHMKVREELKLECQSRSDTETILHAYHKLGAKCLNYFDGMFALCIYDKKERKLFLARDRAGKKPLYFYHKNDNFAFASELNALRKQLDLKINEAHINEYLIGAFINGKTAYENVTELLGGCYMTLDIDKPIPQIQRWWNINNAYNNPVRDDYPTVKANVRQYLNDAVLSRIDSSDLEVGTFLSGGIDSGLVTAMAAKINPSIQAFTIAFEGAFDESKLATLVAKKYNVSHEIINIKFDNLQNDFEKIISNYGEPFADSSAIPSYYVSQAAKKHLTVVLNGDGADELFAGYRRYVLASKYDLYNMPGWAKKLSKLGNNILPEAHNKKSYYNFFRRLVNIFSTEGKDVYWATTSDMWTGFENQFNELPKSDSIIYNLMSLLENSRKLTGLQKQMNLDFLVLLGGILLKKMDIATMANSLEGRSPFLCKELLNYAPRISDSYKIKGTQTKYVLRDIAKDLLPPELVNQPKRGFEIPLKNWVENEFSDMINDRIATGNDYVSKFIDKKFLRKLIDNKIPISKEKRAKMLYRLLVTEIWYNENYKVRESQETFNSFS